MGCSLEPSLHKSNNYFPVSNNFMVVHTDLTSSADCIRIQPILSALHSVFRNVGFSGSNRVNIGEEVNVTFNSSNSVMNSGDHAIIGIIFL